MKRLALFLLFLTCTLHGQLTFDKKLKEVTAELDGSQVICDYEFTNETDHPVTIARYEATCSCMSVKVKEGKLKYEPGEKGMLRGIFDVGNFSGTVDKALRIWLQDDPPNQPSITLTTRIHIPVLVELEPKTLRWDLDENGSPEAQTISIKIQHDQPIRVLSAECGNETFGTELIEVEEGKSYELKVTPTSLANPSLGVIQIRTDSDSSRYATQRAFALIRKPIPGEVTQ